MFIKFMTFTDKGTNFWIKVRAAFVFGTEDDRLNFFDNWRVIKKESQDGMMFYHMYDQFMDKVGCFSFTDTDQGRNFDIVYSTECFPIDSVLAFYLKLKFKCM